MNLACLDESRLQQLVQGQLPEEQAIQAEEHLLACSRCAGLAEEQFSPLIELLRRAARPGRAPEQERVDRLVEQLERLAGPPAEGEGASPPVAPSEALADAAEVLLGPPRAPDEIGRLGPFRVLGLLAEGGMGAVFRAADPGLGREVAIKVIRRRSGSEEPRQRILREARAIAALDHDNVVPIWHVGEEGGQPFLVMPLLRGESLGARLRSGAPLPLPLVLQVARETANGLAAVHAAGLIHRDLKPDNLWLESRREGLRVRLLDFSLVIGPAEPGQAGYTAVVGTPAYMAPEQAWGGPPDARGDLFSLGCVLYECLAGRRAFEGRTLLAVLWALAHHELRPLHEVAPAVPRPVADLVMRLLARQPDNRPASAAEVVAAVRELEALTSTS
jgi:serine/threonine protein kinase